MTSWDGFQTVGFDSFRTLGYDARNGPSCVPTTLVATGIYVWAAPLASSPTYTLNGSVTFDSLGRMWVAPTNTADRKPYLYDADANLLFTGPVQTGRLLYPSDAGHGAAVMVVFDEVSLVGDKLVCFDATDASVKWTYQRAGADFDNLSYVAGQVFAGFTDKNDGDAFKTICLDATDGTLVDTVNGKLRAVAPDGGLLVIDTGLTQFTRYELDRSTVAWTKPYIINGQAVRAFDVDVNGVAWLLTLDELISISLSGAEVVAAITEINTASWSVLDMAVDLCHSTPRAFIRGNFFLPIGFSPRQSTIQALVLDSPSINPNDGNFPSTIGGSSSLSFRINGKWSIFT